MAHPQVYIICELLGCVKRAVLLFQSCKISMTQVNNKITKGVLVLTNTILMVSQKPETSNQRPMTHCNDIGKYVDRGI